MPPHLLAGEGSQDMLSERSSKTTGWPMLCSKTTGRPMLCLALLVVALFRCPQQADAFRNMHHDRSEQYLHMPLHVITTTTYNETESEMFQISFNRTRNIDTPMDMELVRHTREKFWEHGWKSKILYVLKSLRKLPHDQLVILADSRDIVWLPCGRDLRKVFKDFDHDIVIGACDFQYPDTWKEDLFPDIPILKPEIPFTDHSSNVHTKYKFINAGVIMGTAGALLHYMGGAFLRYNVVDKAGDFDDQSFWADMYLAQFYDDAASASRHPSIVIDAGFMAVTQGVNTFSPVGDAGYWQSDMSRFTACIAHAPGGPDNREPLFEYYNTRWSKTFDYKTAQAARAKPPEL